MGRNKNLSRDVMGRGDTLKKLYQRPEEDPGTATIFSSWGLSRKGMDLDGVCGRRGNKEQF